MTYNEYAQVLEAKNPATRKLYQPGDLNVVDFNKEGTAMLEDGIFSTESFLKDGKNQDTTRAFGGSIRPNSLVRSGPVEYT